MGKTLQWEIEKQKPIIPPHNQNNHSINFGFMSIGTYHNYSSNEPNYTHYPRAYSFESNDDHSRTFGLFNFLSSGFPHEVHDLQNTRLSN